MNTGVPALEFIREKTHFCQKDKNLSRYKKSKKVFSFNLILHILVLVYVRKKLF
jgi:hypothetical protein